MIAPTAIVVVIGSFAPSALSATGHDSQSAYKIAHAREESRALAAKAHLTRNALIAAAREAEARHTLRLSSRRVGVSRIVTSKSTLGRARSVANAAKAVTAGQVRLDSYSQPLLICGTCPGAYTVTLTSPLPEAITSATFGLGAQLTGGLVGGTGSYDATAYTGVTYEYRIGTTGNFADIPASAVTNGTKAVQWPEAVTEITSGEYAGEGVQSPTLTWAANTTLASDGLIQIEAVFSGGPSGNETTSASNATFDRVGTGGDFAAAPVGPATVGLQSGNLSLAATDVSISSYGAGLSVSRTFNTHASATPSIFGPGWTSSVPVEGTSDEWSSITNDGSFAVLTSSVGSAMTFAEGAPSGGITPYSAQGQAAASGLALTLGSSGFTLVDPSGDQVKFAAENSSTPSYYTPTQVSAPGNSQSVGYIYDATKTDASYGNPLLVVAPDAALAAGTSNTTACPYPASSSTWAAGCRGLQFSYNSSGDVSQVTFESYNGTTVTSTPVAAYSYDSQERLVKEWDPRITPNLVNAYTYDEAVADPTYGFLTSVSPAQAGGTGYLQPWTFSYNTTATSQDYLKAVSASRSDSRGTGTQTIDYEVPLTTAAGGPVNMDPATVGSWNQTDLPAAAVAVFPATYKPSSPPASADWQHAEITYYDANGMAVNTADYSSGAWDIATTQYDAYGDTLSQLTAADRAEALAAGSRSASVAAELETVSQYTQLPVGSEELTATYGPLHNADVAGVSGVQQVRDLTTYTYDQGAPNNDVAADGLPYQLVTNETESASIGAGIPGTANDDPRTTTSAYSNGSDNTGWTIYQPMKMVTDPSGLAITKTTKFNENSGLYGGNPLVTSACMPSDTSCSGAGTQQTIYYTAGTNPQAAACGNEPAWANLLCETEPAAQPGTSGLPNLPVTVYTYNVYLQPGTETQTIGSATRTYTWTYDAAGRQINETITTTGSGMGAAVPKTQTVYSPNTGLVTDQETLNSSGAVTADIKSGYDDFGDRTSYTDASGNPSSYSYNLAEQITSEGDGKGTDTITYDSAGLPISVADSQAGTFSVTYNPDGNIATESYPGGVAGTYGYDETGTPTKLAYAGADWTAPLTDTVTPDAFGSWASASIADTATALSSNQAYSYDNADRLTSVQDTKAGQCTTRTYAYTASSDRTSVATAAPGSGGVCTTASPSTENYTYDSADRLTNTGYTYDTQGDITATPSVDSGGNGTLNATYYANDMLASQGQASQAFSWTLDPTQTRYGTYSAGSVTYTNHYSSSSGNSAWTSGSDGSWNRAVTGANGMLAATVTASGVTLELANLHGDVLATATTSPTANGPTAGYVYSEFGKAEVGTPGMYGWLGADQISGAALGNDMLMGVRAYSTSDGRFDQVDPLTGGSANAYDYSRQQPNNITDLSGGWAYISWHWWGATVYCSYHFSVKLVNDSLYALSILVGILSLIGPQASIEAAVVFGLIILREQNAVSDGRCVDESFVWPLIPLMPGNYYNSYCHSTGGW
jgi:YD repeat-containing protein